MATLILSTYNASSDGSGFNSIAFDGGRTPVPLPQEQVEIRTAADASEAFESYVERAKATSKGAWVTGNLRKRDRAPNGFRRLRLERFVNV